MTVNRLNSHPTFAELISDVAAGVGELAAAHVDQLGEELRAKSGRLHVAFRQQMIGVIASSIGAVFLLEACVRALIDAGGWTPALAWLTVGTVPAAVGIGLFALGKSQWTSVDPLPRETLHSIRESLSCLNRQ